MPSADRPARTGSTPAIEENVETIKAWDRALLLKRSRLERFSDWITRSVASGPSLLGHAVWFVGWILLNTRVIPGVEPFDPYPFQLLTMLVSLQAIFLALFVLASQNRMAKQADLRANLDLQIDLLVEREMTAVLQLLKDLAQHNGVPTSIQVEDLTELSRKTDIGALANEVDR